MQWFKGFYYFLRGFQLILQPTIRRWVFFPLLINSLLFILLIYYSWIQYQIGSTYIINYLQTTLPPWVTDLIQWLILPFFMIIIILGIFFTFTFFATLIAAPFNGLLAEAVERRLSQQPILLPKISWFSFFIGLIWGHLEKLLYYLRWVLLLALLSLIPGFNLITPILWFLFGAWLVTLEYADAPLGNHGYRPPAQRRLLRKKPQLALGFGSIILITMLIPGLNLFVMPAAVAGATCLWVEEWSQLTE